MLSEKAQCESLHAILKDLASILQTLGRLAEHFSGKHFLKRLADAQTLINQCVISVYMCVCVCVWFM